MTRPRIIDVPPEWLRPIHKARDRAKRLTATVAEQAIERQCQRAERGEVDTETERL